MFAVMFNKTISLGLLLVPLLLSACLSQSNVQANYVAQQLLCQEASRVAAEASPESLENAPISVSQFAQCMRQAGWNVAMPKAPAPTQPAAAQPVQQQPQQQPVTAPQAQPVAPQQQTPPLAQQSPAPVAATPQAQPSSASGAAVYQPARPAGAADVYYGSGAGRQF